MRQRRAGIAQLVEQAIENRRVPSSNLGPGIHNAPRVMRSPRPEASSNQLFDNADSFGMVFDEAWKRHTAENPIHVLTSSDKLDLILMNCADHPFVLTNPAMARQVAEFRIRLLGL